MENKKCAFVITDIEENALEKFNSSLSELLHVPIEMRKTRSCQFIYVPFSKYEEGIMKGMELANRMHLPIKWVHYYNSHVPLNYMSVMYGFLPEDRRDMVYENFASSDAKTPYDIMTYITKLETFLGGKHVMIQYNAVDNAIAFFVEGDFSSQAPIRSQCERFVSTITHTPFIHTVFTKACGQFLEDTYLEKEDSSKIYQVKLHSNL